MRPRRLPLIAFFLVVTSTVAACTVYAPAPGPPAPRISAEVALFYDELLPYGDWTWIDVHGWVWSPRRVPVGWRPYTHGYWVRTGHGWTWVSDWQWGWAPFHYGRWTWYRDLGWVWVPDAVWAPAWVAWRHGPDWIGWAPLPPGARWRAGIGLDLGGVVIDLDWWSFVPTRHFVDRHLRAQIVPGRRDPGLARITRPVTRYEGDRNVIERSVPVAAVERATGRPEASDGAAKAGPAKSGSSQRSESEGGA